MRNRLSWGERISNALERDLFQLHFQGVYQAEDGSLSHLEALIRMVDERNPGQLIMPVHFIPLAEKSGRILDIDRWVIRQVVRMLAESPAIPPSPSIFPDARYPSRRCRNSSANELREREVDPSRLIVEITETVCRFRLARCSAHDRGAAQMGCGISLDDFGVGFASFAYLKHFNVDTIKIDGMFIRDLPSEPDNQIFVQAMVSVALGSGQVRGGGIRRGRQDARPAAPDRRRSGTGLSPGSSDPAPSGAAGRGLTPAPRLRPAGMPPERAQC